MRTRDETFRVDADWLRASIRLPEDIAAFHRLEYRLQPSLPGGRP
jgi:hypothetical protein